MEKWIHFFFFFFFALLSLFSLVGARGKSGKVPGFPMPESDRVTNLPGQPKVSFQHYAGYVKLRPEDEKALFYWFFEAEGGVEGKPVLLWLNGGPGCSSIAYGALQELGPFLVMHNSTELTLNQYAWNKVANLLFLESPVGVGFSYTNKSEDLWNLGDQITAEDSYTFLLRWFEKFPSMKSHDFYIAGESYAGHYVPQLAEQVYDHNKNASNESYINLKGIMIGNAVMNDETDQSGMVDYAWSHAVISDELHQTVMHECDFKSDKQTIGCSAALRTFLASFSNIDIYSIYSPVCLSSRSSMLTMSRLVASPKAFSQHDLWHRIPSGIDPCSERYTTAYLRRNDVQKALHANVTNLGYAYSPCSNIIRRWNDAPDSVLPVISKLMKAGVRVWVFSGDTDARIPVTSTRYSLNTLSLKEKAGWRAWSDNQQVAGWTVEYNNLTFSTVRGAGHQVPMYAPRQSLTLLVHFLSGKSLPSSQS